MASVVGAAESEKWCFDMRFDTKNGFWNYAIFKPDNAILRAEIKVF